jgi:hypothetical protein
MSDAIGNHIELTAQIVSAYVSNNTVAAGDIPGLINQVHAALTRVSGKPGDATSEPLRPAVSVKKSITPEYIVCLEDGKKFKSLKRCRLSNGRAQLRGRPLAIGQANGSRPTAPPARLQVSILRSNLCLRRGWVPVASFLANSGADKIPTFCG